MNIVLGFKCIDFLKFNIPELVSSRLNERACLKKKKNGESLRRCNMLYSSQQVCKYTFLNFHVHTCTQIHTYTIPTTPHTTIVITTAPIY